MNVLGTHLYQCASWHYYERLCLALVNFFWRLFQCVFRFHDGWFTSAPAHTTLSVQQFHTKNSTILVTHPPLFTQSHPERYFVCLCPWMKRVLKRKHFADVEEVKQKNRRTTKRHQNWWVQKLFWAVGKNVSIGVLHQMESTLKVSEVLNM